MLTTEERAIVQAARDLIADPKHWCEGTLALGRVEIGPAWRVLTPMAPEDPLATQWCAYGALTRERVRRGNYDERIYRLLDLVSMRLFPASDPAPAEGPKPLAWVNDQFGHDAVLAVFDKVLADETVA